MKYDLIIFDFDGVLINSGFDGFAWAEEARRQVLEENGWDFDLEGIEQGIFQPNTSEKIAPLLKDKNVSWKQLQLLEERVAEKKIKMAENGEMNLFEDAENVLSEIKAEKAIVSNAFGDYLPQMLEALGISQHFSLTKAPTISNIKKYRARMKPESTMLQETMNYFGTKNAVMIGDQIEDILAARRSGIDSIYVNRDGESIEKADHEVKRLSEILELI